VNAKTLPSHRQTKTGDGFVKFALSPFVIAPLDTTPLEVLSPLDVPSFVSTSLDPTPFLLPFCLKIASLGQRFPEHRVQLHAVLGERGRGQRQAKQRGGNRNSKRQAGVDRHGLHVPLISKAASRHGWTILQ
jgi:hypothetical protein